MPQLLVPVDHLRVGVYIHLKLKWYEHPFLMNSFKIKNSGQIQTLKELGLSRIRYDPLKSDQLPSPPAQSPQKHGPEPAQGTSSEVPRDHLWEVKRQRIRQLQERNRRIQNCEKQYHRTFGKVQDIMHGLVTGSEEASKQANMLIQSMVESLLAEREVVVHLLNIKGKDEGIYYHTLNVAILSLLLGKECGMKSESMEYLGLGALFHDIGKSRIPKKVLHKKGPLTNAERQLLQLHPKYGEEMAKQINGFPSDSALIIKQHHETDDGTGYPGRLQSQNISVLSKVMSIANAYDNYCNHRNPDDSMTPHEAMSQMFCLMKSKFDSELLSLFIHCMGIYPPGTVVQLSNDLIGMVVSMNPSDQLRPCVLVYDEGIPPKEALLLDLIEDPEVSIVQSIRPSQLPPEIYAYLNPRSRVSYFFETLEKRPSSPYLPTA